MSGAAKEIQPSPKPGNIVLGTELFNSLKGIEHCRHFFDGLKLIDYLKSLNSFYLDGKGKISKPVSRIASDVGKEENDSEVGFNLDNSWGGITASLEWDKKEETFGKSINISIFYSNKNDYYQLYLGGSISEVNNLMEGVVAKRTFYRQFGLNPPSITQDQIDCILLNFTNEAIEAKIL